MPSRIAHDDVRLWRYISASAALEIIENSKLRMTNLRYFPDELDGTWPFHLYDEEPFNTVQAQMKYMALIAKDRKYASCWSKNDPSNMTMWTSYAECSAWVALESSIHQLQKGLQREDRDLEIGFVKYWDTSDIVEFKRPEEMSLLKRRAFEFEQECRVVWVNMGEVEIDEKNNPTEYIHSNFDLSSIVAIHLGPFMTPEFQESFQSKIHSIRPNIKIEESPLKHEPEPGFESLDTKSRLRRVSQKCVKDGNS